MMLRFALSLAFLLQTVLLYIPNSTQAASIGFDVTFNYFFDAGSFTGDGEFELRGRESGTATGTGFFNPTDNTLSFGGNDGPVEISVQIEA